MTAPRELTTLTWHIRRVIRDVVWRPREALRRGLVSVTAGLLGAGAAAQLANDLALAPIGYLAVASAVELVLELTRRTLWPEQRVLFWLEMEGSLKSSIDREEESAFNMAQHAVRAAVERGDDVPIEQWRAAAEGEADPESRRFRLAWVALVDAAVKRAYGVDARAVPRIDPGFTRSVRLRGKHRLMLWAVRLSNLVPHVGVALLWVLFGLLFL